MIISIQFILIITYINTKDSRSYKFYQQKIKNECVMNLLSEGRKIWLNIVISLNMTHFFQQLQLFNMIQSRQNLKITQSNLNHTNRKSNKDQKVEKQIYQDLELKKSLMQNLERIQQNAEQNDDLIMKFNANALSSLLFRRSFSQMKKSDLFSSADLQATSLSNYLSILPSDSSNFEDAATPTSVQKRLKAMNQFITGISRRYIQRINLLENFQKASKEKIHQLTQRIQGLEQMNKKLLRECQFRQQRSQILENQLNIISFRNKQYEAKSRQSLFIIEEKNYENRSLLIQNQNLKKRVSFQPQYLAKIQELNCHLIQSQRDKQRLQAQLKRAKESHQHQMHKIITSLKESGKRHNIERENLQKQLIKISKKLDQRLQASKLIQSQQRQLKKSLQLQKQQDYKLKTQMIILTNQLASLKQSVLQAQKQLQLAQNQIKTLNPLKQQIKGLKSNIQEKDQLIAILRKKIIQLQNLLGEYQCKINEGQQHIQNLAQGYRQLQSQKKQLLQQIQIKKQSMVKLISQLEFTERNAQAIQQQLGGKILIYDEQKQFLKQVYQRAIQQKNNLKHEKEQMEKEWSQQVQKYKSISIFASNLQSKNELLESEVTKLNMEKMSLSQQYFRLQSEAQQLDNEKHTLVSQIGELKSQKSMKQSHYDGQMNEFSKIAFKKARQADQLAQQISKLKQSTRKLEDENSQKYHELIDKEKVIQQLHDQIFDLRQEKFKIQSQLQSIQISSSHRQYLINERQQELEQLKQYIEVLQMHINELDNILVWDVEFGQGQTNDFDDRRRKMEVIVKNLQAKQKENIALNKSIRQRQEQIEKLSDKNQQYAKAIDKYSQTITNFLKDKEALKHMIEEIQQSNKILVEKLQKIKQNQSALIVSERNLTKNIKYKQRAVSKLQNENKEFKQKLDERQKQNEVLIEQIRQIRQRNRSNEQIIEKLTEERKKQEEDFKKKLKQLTNKYDMSKRQNQERKKALGILENEKKTQVYALNSQLSTAKNQMKQLTLFYDGQKFNYLKRNLLLNDLGNTLTRLQKNNNIKGQFLIPLKEIVKKLELFDSNSAKLFAKIGRLDIKQVGGNQY